MPDPKVVSPSSAFHNPVSHQLALTEILMVVCLGYFVHRSHLMNAKLTSGACLLCSLTRVSPTVTTLRRSTLVLLTLKGLRRAAQRHSG